MILRIVISEREPQRALTLGSFKLQNFWDPTDSNDGT